MMIGIDTGGDAFIAYAESAGEAGVEPVARAAMVAEAHATAEGKAP